MNLSKLLASRELVLAQARLANLAYAYSTLKSLAGVIRRGRLSGLVRLSQPNENEERYWASLTALSGSQAVLDEHFSDDDVAAMADAIAFVRAESGLDLTFALEELESTYVAPLETQLERAGVSFDSPRTPVEERSE